MNTVSPDLSDRLQFAVDIARQAGEVTLKYFQQDNYEVDLKADNSPVTIADQQAEQLLIADLFAAELGHVTDDQKISALEGLVFAINVFLEFGFAEIVAFHHSKTVGLLQMADEYGFGLVAEAVYAVRKQATQKRGAVFKLADRQRVTRTVVNTVGRFHFGGV